MLRNLLPIACCASTLLSSAAAQTPEPITAPIRNAGTYHVKTGQWTRSNAAAPVGETIYNNDAPQGQYLPLDSNWMVVDSGRIPGPTSPAPEQGLLHGYSVKGFQFAYCSSDLKGQFSYELSFFNGGYEPCVDPAGVYVPEGSITLNDLPGAVGFAGSEACWIVTIDLTDTTGAFCYRADGGDGIYDADPARDSFGVGVRLSGNSHPGGPILAGDPASAAHGDGTLWHADTGATGTGLGAIDGLWLDDDADVSTGCVSFVGSGIGQVPFASFHLQLYADTTASECGSTLIGASYGCSSTPNSTGEPATIIASGSPSVVLNNFHLRADGLPPGETGYFLVGQDFDMVLNPGGSAGNLCVGGYIYRLKDQAQIAGPTGAIELQVDLQYITGQDPFLLFRTFQCWYRDGQTSNFTDGVVVFFE